MPKSKYNKKYIQNKIKEIDDKIIELTRQKEEFLRLLNWKEDSDCSGSS